MFVDDVLVYLAQPTQTLPKLMDILKEYGTLSGYKLNIKKTQVITFNYDPPSCIRGRYNLKWDADSI